MSFNNLLRDAEPEDFARAAKVLAKDTLSDTKTEYRAPERTQQIARWVLSKSHEELVQFKKDWDARRAAEAAE